METIVVVLLFAVLFAVGYWIVAKQWRINYEMYATFARDWHDMAMQARGARENLREMEIPDDDVEARRFRDVVIAGHDEDIRRYEGFVRHYASMVPHRLRSKLGVPDA